MRQDEKNQQQGANLQSLQIDGPDASLKKENSKSIRKRKNKGPLAGLWHVISQAQPGRRSTRPRLDHPLLHSKAA